MNRRIASLWFPRLASDRLLRKRTCHTPFALTIRENDNERLYCLNEIAEADGLTRGMPVSDARALCPDLRTVKADPREDRRFLIGLARWARRYCPWTGLDGEDGLVLDITGSSHLIGGEKALATDLRASLARAGLQAKIGIGDTRGGAWALARFREGIAAEGGEWEHLAELPVAALRLDKPICVDLARLGIRTIAELAALPRASVTRRFGSEPVKRLDQALGHRSEEIPFLPEIETFTARLTLPEPIGLLEDVMAALERLSKSVSLRLQARGKGARIWRLTLDRVDRASHRNELRLARAMHDPNRIKNLFERHIAEIDAGFGIDRMRLEAVQIEELPGIQIDFDDRRGDDELTDLINRLGNRAGLDNIIRFLPADSHIPERSFIAAPAAYSEPGNSWAVQSWPFGTGRPLRLFPPERIATNASELPERFRWRSMELATARAIGPERIAPEWWRDDPAWASGLRDYWQVDTRQGWRLWMFYTPRCPAWFVHGKFA